MTFDKAPHSHDEVRRQTELAFGELITHLGGVTLFNELHRTVVELPRQPRGVEGVTLSVDPDELGEGTPGLHLEVRPDSVDFSVGPKGPYHLAMEQAVALLPAEDPK